MAQEGERARSCPVSRRCGGCEWLDVPYPEQLERKQAEVEDLFAPLCDSSLVYPIIGMDEPSRCRNKILVPFAPGRRGRIVYGLYEKGTHKVVRKDDCLVEDEAAAPILATVARLAESFRIRPYDEKTGNGFLRYVLIRVGAKTGQVLVCLVCNGEEFKGSKAFVRELRRAHPEITTVVMNINRRRTNAIMGEKERVLYGKGWIEDELLGCRFRISSTSFYQVNPRQTEKLYAEAMEMANLRSDSAVLDAYCGTGTIGIIASRSAGSLVGVESNAAAVKDARANAKRNGVENARFVAQDAGDFMRRCADEGEGFDAVFMDPPRSGSDERFLKSLARMHPAKVVYISCSPETQARDCSYLLDSGYFVKKLQPVDMFPHTPHVENIALLMADDGD